jgi:hypothetical protein
MRVGTMNLNSAVESESACWRSPLQRVEASTVGIRMNLSWRRVKVPGASFGAMNLIPQLSRNRLAGARRYEEPKPQLQNLG